MNLMKFLNWVHWTSRNDLLDIYFPGIYVLAISDKDLTGNKFSFKEDIIYIGITNAKNGLKVRLNQFDNTVSLKRNQHGGSDRVLYAHQNYNELIKMLFISVYPVRCFPEKIDKENLLIMGEIAKLGYVAFAEFVLMLRNFPKFNRRSSPKCSKMIKKF